MTKPTPHRRRLPPKAEIPSTLPSASAEITRAFLSALIAKRLGISNNLASHRISYAVKTGKLLEARPGHFIFEGAGLWARWKWPGKFDDLPMKPGTGDGAFELPLFTVAGTGQSLPETLSECHAELLAMIQRIVGLEAQLQARDKTIAKLRPYEERAKQRIEKGRKYGKQGGRGNEKKQ